jgi:hypothetical protein
MTESEIKMHTIKQINGIKHLPGEMVEGCKDDVRRTLGLEDTEENNRIIQEAIKTYFSIKTIGK